MRIWPALYFEEGPVVGSPQFPEQLGWKDLFRYSFKNGLKLEIKPNGKISISGYVISDNMVACSKILLVGKKATTECWTGESTVWTGPYFKLKPWEYFSEWSLQRAPEDVVWETAVIFLNNLNGARVMARMNTFNYVGEVLVFLKSPTQKNWPTEDFAFKFRDSTILSIAIRALEEKKVVYSSNRFKLSEEARKHVDKQKQDLAGIDMNVTVNRSKIPPKPTTFVDSQFDPYFDKYKPPFSGRRIRLLAANPDPKARRMRLAYKGKRHIDIDKQLGYTWKELRFIPDAVFLTRDMTKVPMDLREKIINGYIRDGSRDWFSDMSFEQLHAVPNPFLLTACLPHMKAEDAAALAETERVGKILKTAELKPSEITGLSIPQVIYSMLAKLPTNELQPYVDSLPKMRAYLYSTSDYDLQELVRERGLIVTEKAGSN